MDYKILALFFTYVGASIIQNGNESIIHLENYYSNDELLNTDIVMQINDKKVDTFEIDMYITRYKYTLGEIIMFIINSILMLIIVPICAAAHILRNI